MVSGYFFCFGTLVGAPEGVLLAGRPLMAIFGCQPPAFKPDNSQTSLYQRVLTCSNGPV